MCLHSSGTQFQNSFQVGNNLLLLDTSGRLHNNANLMAELQKINRVLKKHNENFPQEVILVLDGTMGQNLKDQVENFDKSVKITGLIVTKLDGSSRGGIILSLVKRVVLFHDNSH